MNLELAYLGRSGLTDGLRGRRLLQLAPNLVRDAVAFDGKLTEPLRFREAISALHDVVISDLRFEPRDKTAYQQWKQQVFEQEGQIRRDAMKAKRQAIAENRVTKPTRDLKSRYQSAKRKYWKARAQLNQQLRREDPTLWRKLMPYDPVITVADDVVMFECFSADESSYGCLAVDRHACFGDTADATLGTTNVDYSWDLYHSFQTLRTYRETRFQVDPTGFEVQTTDQADYREEKIELPDGWLRGFLQLQCAMCLPMRHVPLSVGAVYSLLAFLRRNKARSSPRAIRFEVADGAAPRLVLEPWEREITSHTTVYRGPADEPIRVWGRRRLLTLARVLPLCDRIDVYLLGTGLPSFWVARMGNMRLTLGLSGWTTNDWTRGSAMQMILPTVTSDSQLMASLAEHLSQQRACSLASITGNFDRPAGEIASALNQLAGRGQLIYDLDAHSFRWRQVLPIELSDRELGEAHPELAGAAQLVAKRAYTIESTQPGPRQGWIVVGKVGNQPCEALVTGDGMVKRGKCRCTWHYQYGVRNGPCRHLQVLRDVAWSRDVTPSGDDWYRTRMRWAGQA